MLNLDKFIELKKQQKKKKKKCYKNIKSNIYHLIENKIKSNINFILYEMPPYVIGEAEYNILECINYIIEKIKDDEQFKKILEEIQYYQPNVLYIKWNFDKIK